MNFGSVCSKYNPIQDPEKYLNPAGSGLMGHTMVFIPDGVTHPVHWADVHRLRAEPRSRIKGKKFLVHLGWIKENFGK